MFFRYDDHVIGGWGWFAMAISMLLFLALIVTIVFLLWRAITRSGPGGWTGPLRTSGAEQLLAERYARGEIDEEEYQRRLATLRGSRPGGSPPGAAKS
ncbi:SHOCT domain-containing protein [Streptomyces halobius]|uniref:SHOCT domain-containing protein n=1 Tax=Streptomyces halobius TaxID=2879846 RepID=A0ABY4M8I8_9ACTN|nr:SHOCT domain-containing protein [Streptomyces halobius]UQA94099.1 SHOCT domain-containing protein [Streptomyces halobius]